MHYQFNCTLPGESITPGTTGSPTEGATESPTEGATESPTQKVPLSLLQKVLLGVLPFCLPQLNTCFTLHECNCTNCEKILGDRN